MLKMSAKVLKRPSVLCFRNPWTILWAQIGFYKQFQPLDQVLRRSDL